MLGLKVFVDTQYPIDGHSVTNLNIESTLERHSIAIAA